MRTIHSLLIATMLVFLQNVAPAFWINSVTLSPGNYVAPWFPVQMTVDITTPGMPAFLYKATEVTSDGLGLHINIYPDSGMLTAFGNIRTQIDLGTFSP